MTALLRDLGQSCPSCLCHFSEREMELTMVLQNDMNTGLLWCGLSGKKLGTLPPNESLDIPLNLIATSPGLQVGLHIVVVVVLNCVTPCNFFSFK